MKKATIETIKDLLHTSIEMSSVSISTYVQLNQMDNVNYWNETLQRAVDAERDLNEWLERRNIIKRIIRKLQSK